MTEIGECVAVNTIADPENTHWAQVEYTYTNGKPVQGYFTAQSSDGLFWVGMLNDQGQACLTGLPPGSVEFNLLPSEEEEAELKEVRAKVKEALDAILADERAAAAAIEKELAQQSALMKGVTHYGAYAKGFWNGAVGLLTFAKDVVVKVGQAADLVNPVSKLNNLLHASYTSYKNGDMSSGKWRQTLADNYKEEEFKDLAAFLGFDVRTLDAEKLQQIKDLIVEAYEITAFIASDPESLDMLTTFAKDYAGAQSSVEWAEFAGGGVFEIVVTALLLAFTGGIGNVAQGASKIRHAGWLRALGGRFRRLFQLLKKKWLNRKVKVNVDSKKKVDVELPEGKKLDSNNKKSDRNNTVGRTVAEERAHVKKLSDEAAEAEKKGDLALRDAKIAEARGFLRERVLDNPNIPNEKKPQALIDRLDVSSPKDKSIFWSGDKAKQMAKSSDGVCLETTNGGRIVDEWKELETRFPGWEGDPPPNGYDMWGGLSEKYAQGASGDVTVIQTPDKAAQGGGYIWKSKEAPVLNAGQKAGRVGKITTIVIGQ